MTDELGWVALGVKPDAASFPDDLSRQIGPGLASQGSRIGARFSAGFKKAALAGGAVISAAGLAAFKISKDSIAEAREAQKVGGLTEAVIRSTGHAAGITAKQVGDMATRLSNVSGVDDEVIQRGENMLLTFKGIQNYVKGQFVGTFDQASQATLDMAAAMSGGKGGELDLKSSSILVGKALNDPVKGLTALQRVGVAFTKTQQAQIKALVEGGDANAAVAMGLLDSGTAFSTLLKAQGGDINKTVAILTKDLTPAQKKVYDMYAAGGHTLEAQQKILKELNSEFGGAAAAQATMGEKVQVAWGNIEEQLGTAILPLVDQAERAFLNKGVPALQAWAGAFDKEGVPAIRGLVHEFRQDGIPAIEDFYHQAKPVAEDVLPAIFDVIKAGHPVVKAAAREVGHLADAFSSMPKWAQTAIAGGLLAGKFGGFKLAGSLLGKGGLGSLASRSAPLPVIVMNKGFGGVTGETGGKGTGSTYMDGNEDRRRRRRRGAATGAALVAGVVGDELTGGKVSEILTHPLRELGAEFAFPFRAGEGSAFNFAKSQDFLLNKAKSDGSLFRGGDLSLSDPQFSAGVGKNQEVIRGFTIDVEKSIATVKKYQRVLDGTPRQVKTWVGLSGYEKVMGQLDTLDSKIHALGERGQDNGIPYVHGGQRPSVNVHIEHAHVNDGRDLLQKSQQASLGGRPW